MADHVPNGYNQVMPYLILQGASKFLEFTKAVFDAKEADMHYEPDGRIVHGQVVIGDSIILFADTKEPWTPMPAGMFVYVENADQSFQKALDAGANVVMELSDQSYGRTCGVKDPCSNTWWITSVRS